jgi:hypothetical protein
MGLVLSRITAWFQRVSQRPCLHPLGSTGRREAFRRRGLAGGSEVTRGVPSERYQPRPFRSLPPLPPVSRAPPPCCAVLPQAQGDRDRRPRTGTSEPWVSGNLCSLYVGSIRHFWQWQKTDWHPRDQTGLEKETLLGSSQDKRCTCFLFFWMASILVSVEERTRGQLCVSGSGTLQPPSESTDANIITMSFWKKLLGSRRGGARL